jgi:periplasmic divalent cation tolerance protein
MIGNGVTEPSDIRLVYCTFADEEEARTIARTVVREQLAACANIMPATTSIFHWQGELTEKPEVPVLFKTALPQSKALAARIVHLHSYDEPALLVLPVEYCPPSFRAWVLAETLATD